MNVEYVDDGYWGRFGRKGGRIGIINILNGSKEYCNIALGNGWMGLRVHVSSMAGIGTLWANLLHTFSFF